MPQQFSGASCASSSVGTRAHPSVDRAAGLRAKCSLPTPGARGRSASSTGRTSSKCRRDLRRGVLACFRSEGKGGQQHHPSGHDASIRGDTLVSRPEGRPISRICALSGQPGRRTGRMSTRQPVIEVDPSATRAVQEAPSLRHRAHVERRRVHLRRRLGQLPEGDPTASPALGGLGPRAW